MESMTGYGRATREREGVRVTVEMRGVNQKGLDMHLKLPPALWSQEIPSRERIRSRIGRGRVEVSVILEMLAAEAVEVQVSEGLLKSLGALAAAQVDGGLLVRGLTFSDVLSVPEALTISLAEGRRAAAYSCMEEALACCLEAFVKTRSAEGERLRGQFGEGCERLEALLGGVRAHEGTQVSEVRRRLEERLAELGPRLDPQRLEQEILLLSQKADIREEAVRLVSHAGALRDLLESEGGDQGRRLDHLLQEMQREVSTLLAKAAFLDLTRLGMEMRLVVEQLREQAQNVA